MAQGRKEKEARGRTLGVRIDDELAKFIRRFATKIGEDDSTAVRMIMRDRQKSEKLRT
jgi:antitoxin component of RelBE/YafQ-DinJ toxin-antitoxin module